MNLIDQVRNLLQRIRDAAADGKISLREMVEIAVALGDLLRVIGELIPGAVHETTSSEESKETTA